MRASLGTKGELMNVSVQRLGLLAACGLLAGSVAFAASLNGSAGDMPAYYDAQLFTINFKQLPSGGENANLQHNGSINTIYMCDQCESGASGFLFIAVIDAIQGDGFNPLWAEVQITFNGSNPPRQFTSDDQILEAAQNGEITLTPTGELYRCSVVGAKK